MSTNIKEKVILLDGLFVGAVGINSQQGWRSHCAEIGYWLGEDYRGQGIATGALDVMTTEAFTRYPLKNSMHRFWRPIPGPYGYWKIRLQTGRYFEK